MQSKLKEKFSHLRKGFVGDLDPKWEVWRFRTNWLFFIITGSLYPISYVAAFTSFHQFVTNPREVNLNSTSENIEPGLGADETFYSWVLAVYNIGSLIGAIGMGCLIKFVPYWYLNIGALLSHMFGYILFLMTYNKWVIVLSKLFAGYFIGAEMTISMSYLAESSVDYTRTMKKLGRKSGKSSDIRNNLFALHNLGIIFGYLIGPGIATVFAQFNINQFRAIAWFNVAVGLAYIVLQLVMFHGEGSFRRVKRRCQLMHIHKYWNGPFELFLVLFLIICRGVLSFRFGVYETIFNPVLSDYFGFTERSSSYFFLGLVFARLLGSVVVLLLQLKLNSRIVAIIGITVSLISFAIIADWQAIPPDPCTDYSPFHHPEILSNYEEITHNQTFNQRLPSLVQTNDKCVQYVPSKSPETLAVLQSITIHSSVDLQQYSSNHHKSNDTKLVLNCHKVVTCHTDHLNNHYKLDSNFCLKPQETITSEESGFGYYAYACVAPIPRVQFSICFDWIDNPATAKIHKRSNQEWNAVDQDDDDMMAHVQVLQVLDDSTNDLAMKNCEEAEVKDHRCHWIPNSEVTRKHCGDCQPICRSIFRKLTFAQFCFGAALLMASIPIGRISVSALLSDRVQKEAQGVVLGASIAISAIGRAVSPLWLDAAYEGIQKRTFLGMLLLAAVHIPFLVGIIIMYRKLGEKHVDQSLYSELASSDTSDSGVEEENGDHDESSSESTLGF